MNTTSIFIFYTDFDLKTVVQAQIGITKGTTALYLNNCL